MTDRIDFGAEPWQAIPRRVLRDPTLTARAKGGLVTLLSHEEGWVRSCIAMLQRECKCGAKQAQAIMAELRERGYAELVTERVDNRIRRHYVISAVPKGPGSQADFTAALSSTPLTGYEPDRTAQGAVVVEALEVDPLDVETQIQTLAPRKRDALWDAFVEVLGLEGQPTKQERKSLNVAVASVRDVWPELPDLSYEDVLSEVQRRATNYDRRYPVASLTGQALARHWGECKNAPMKRNGDERTDRIVEDIFR